MSLLSVIDSFRRDQAAIESTWSTPLAILDTPLNSPFSLCHSLTLTLAAAIAAAAAAVNDSNKVEAAFLYLFFFFCRVVSLLSLFISRSHAYALLQCFAESVLLSLCEGAWARERKQRAASFGSAVRSWRYVNYVYMCVFVCIRAPLWVYAAYGLQ